MPTHVPKNPFCDVCQRAKMFKPPSKTVGGSTQVEAQRFGDHIAADFIVAGDEEEVGIDDGRGCERRGHWFLCTFTPMQDELPMLQFLP
jgi:hypothetical protein